MCAAPGPRDVRRKPKPWITTPRYRPEGGRGVVLLSEPRRFGVAAQKKFLARGSSNSTERGSNDKIRSERDLRLDGI